MRIAFKKPVERALCLVAFFGLGTFPSFVAAQDAPPGKPDGRQTLVDLVNNRISATLSVDLDADGPHPNRPEQSSEFWIGVSGNPVDDALRSHLDLGPDQGILV